jgi:glycosyltransferase involved in cell wall biosynthesis
LDDGPALVDACWDGVLNASFYCLMALDLIPPNLRPKQAPRAGLLSSSRLLNGRRELQVAIIHEWLERYAGSERVLEQMLALFPQADLFTLVDFMPETERAFLGGRRRFRNYLQLMPLAVEQFELAGYDLILSSNHAVAKGAITGPGQLHISYVHSPMRYAWDLQAQYLRQSGLDHGLKGIYTRWLLHQLRSWDVSSANGVDVFVANSHYIADRIRKVYRREAAVVPPPADLERFSPSDSVPSDVYLAVARFVPYKRVDLIVQAFAAMPERSLLVVGDGPDRARVLAAARGHHNIKVRPPVRGDELVSLMRGARAYIHAAEEDFGITIVEAQACGTPVIAFGRGGVRDIITGENATGALFFEQTIASLIDAVVRFEQADKITPAACRINAMRFSTEAFRRNMMSVIENALEEHESCQ